MHWIWFSCFVSEVTRSVSWFCLQGSVLETFWAWHGTRLACSRWYWRHVAACRRFIFGLPGDILTSSGLDRSSRVLMCCAMFVVGLIFIYSKMEVSFVIGSAACLLYRSLEFTLTDCVSSYRVHSKVFYSKPLYNDSLMGFLDPFCPLSCCLLDTWCHINSQIG